MYFSDRHRRDSSARIAASADNFGRPAVRRFRRKPGRPHRLQGAVVRGVGGLPGARGRAAEM